jgi:hypothetical protein
MKEFDTKPFLEEYEKSPSERESSGNLPKFLKALTVMLNSSETVHFSDIVHSFFKHPRDYDKEFKDITDEDFQEIEEYWAYNLCLLRLIRRGLSDGNLAVIAPTILRPTSCIGGESKEVEGMDEDVEELEDVE